jgi:hypothetical protein
MWCRSAREHMKQVSHVFAESMRHDRRPDGQLPDLRTDQNRQGCVT